MNASLESLNRSSESIRSLYFTPSGVFANALSFKPEITKLIRDAQDYEASMYIIDKETGEPRRANGTKSYMEIVESEMEDDVDEELMSGTQHPAVRVPRILIDPISLPKVESKINNVLNRLNNEEYSVEQLIDGVKGLVELHQSVLTNAEEILWLLEDKRTKFEELNRDVVELEEIVDLGKSKLSMMSGDMADKHILNKDTQPKRISAEELIAKEEEEIRELERLLTSKKRQDKELSDSIVKK